MKKWIPLTLILLSIHCHKSDSSKPAAPGSGQAETAISLDKVIFTAPPDLVPVSASIEIVFKEDMIPDVKGMGARDAVFVLENLGLKVNITGRGFVKEQSILPGTRATKGREINLKLSV